MPYSRQITIKGAWPQSPLDEPLYLPAMRLRETEAILSGILENCGLMTMNFLGHSFLENMSLLPLVRPPILVYLDRWSSPVHSFSLMSRSAGLSARWALVWAKHKL